MDRTALVVVAVATVAGAYLIARANLEETTGEPASLHGSLIPVDLQPLQLLDDAMTAIRSTLGLWRPPAKYAPAIAAAEDRHGIPRDMLARLLWQESRYREDIITGRVRSPVGAAGIAQFMPATAAELGIDPLNPMQAIDAAGLYLSRLYRRFGNWTEALAAYNWGQGNVSRKGIANAPRETRNYYSQILADVNTANGTTWA